MSEQAAAAAPSDDEAPDGKVVDYISGIQVPVKPEELLAVQPFARQLVEVPSARGPSGT